MVVTGESEIIQSNNTFSLSPNPATSYCTVNAKEFTNATLILYDMTGRTLLEQPFNTSLELEMSNFCKGVYIVELKSKEGLNIKAKLVRQ